jgi:DNA-binding GntR family transcriptional regulator
LNDPARGWSHLPHVVDVGQDGRMTDVDESPGWLRAVAEEVSGFDRSSTAERVADVLRRRITEGDLPPGSRLSEEQLVAVLRVSRNTLRESFRLLTHEGLLVHQLHRGVFVRVLDEDDLVDLYRLRRAVEGAVVRSLTGQEPLRELADAVAAAERAVSDGDWRAVGTANMRFHSRLVGLAGSRRLDEVTARLLAELRLAFSAVVSPQELHAPYVARNRALLELLERGDVDQAAGVLDDYLDDSLAELLAALAGRRAPSQRLERA